MSFPTPIYYDTQNQQPQQGNGGATAPCQYQTQLGHCSGGGGDSAAPGGSGASSYYSSIATDQQYYHHQPQQYDANGNPICGERGIGTMALGGIGGIAGNKLTGGHTGTIASVGAGAFLAQGGKMAYDMYKKKQMSHHGQPAAGSHHSGGGGLGRLLSNFGGGQHAPPGHGAAGQGGHGGGFFGNRDI